MPLRADCVGCLPNILSQFSLTNRMLSVSWIARCPAKYTISQLCLQLGWVTCTVLANETYAQGLLILTVCWGFVGTDYSLLLPPFAFLNYEHNARNSRNYFGTMKESKKSLTDKSMDFIESINQHLQLSVP